jgi:hypothetical protein
MITYLKLVLIKTGLLLVLIILVQCHTPNNNSKYNKNNHSRTVFFEKDINLMGIGESGIASFYLDWNIHIINNDSIIMLSTLKQNEKDVRLNNGQYYGLLKKSEKYSYEIKISNFWGVQGCVKALNRSVDSIPFFIDSTLLKSVGFWKLKIDGEKDTLVVDKVNFSYKTNTKDDNTNFVMSLIPSKKSGLFPAVIRSSPMCAVDITNKIPDNKYYLNENNEKYELIIERTGNCSNCIRKVQLKSPIP